jgi:isopenicillin-N epimerase
MEAQPTYFMQRILPAELRRSAEAVAEFLSATPEQLVFVENTTAGINAILRSLDFEKGDEILLLSHSYGAVRKTVDYVTSRCGARTIDVQIPFPHPDRQTLFWNLETAIGSRTRIAILDHITSSSALVLPIAEMIQICRSRGVRVVVDGAHAPGQVPINLSVLEADWYVGNCHKWLMAPKGAAFLWARTESPEIHPTAISHGLGAGLAAEFDWVGTRDWSACLSVPVALDFHAKLGGVRLMMRSHDLAGRAASYLAAHFRTTVSAEGEWHAGMSLIKLPDFGGSNPEFASTLRARLLDQRCDASLSYIDGSTWLRVSAAPYNDFHDFVRLADILSDALVSVATV